MKIHILTDNKVKNRGFFAEHGLSLYIEHKNINILFDTGQSYVFIKNANAMHLDLNKIDYIVLSHGHYDHCGGLVYLAACENFPKILVQDSAFAKKYAINPDGKSYREIGIPWSADDYTRLKDYLTPLKGNMKINADITLIGNIPISEEFEEVPKGFYIKNENDIFSDMVADEQILVFDTNKGLIVFLGCSHPGVINCLKYVLKQFPGKKIDTLVAGMHLENISPERLQMTMQNILDLDIHRIFPLHCTGIFAISEMKRFLGNRCHILYVGDSIEL